MSVIIRLQNLPLTASSLDIRNFFNGLAIPDGGVHIVGGPEGDAFIAFSTDEDARQAMRLNGKFLKDSQVDLLLSSRNEMYKVIEQARLSAIAGGGGPPPPSHHPPSGNQQQHYNSHLGSDASPPSHHVSSSSSNSLLGHNRLQASSNSVSSSMSPTSTGSAANDYLRSLAGGNQSDLSSNPALLFSTMSALPSTALGASPNAFLGQQPSQTYPGLHGSSTASPTQQQNQGYGSSSNPTAAIPPPTSIFPNGNPFLIPPPTNMAGMTLPFPGILQGAGNTTSTSSPGNNLSGSGSGAHGAASLGITPTSGVMNQLASNFINSTMSAAGHHAPNNSLNPFVSSVPPRMGMLNNGGIGGPHQSLAGMGMNNRNNNNSNNFGGGMNSHNNAFGAGVGANNGGNRQQHNFGPRTQFGNLGVGNNEHNNQNRFQLGAIPSGRMDVGHVGNNNNRDNNRDNKRSRSTSRERLERRLGGMAEGNNRRRRSRSRDRDRAGGERRRRRSRSRSKSRSRSRERTLLGNKLPSRRDSRDKRDPERRSRSDSSPEKSSQESNSGRRRGAEHEPSPTPNSTNTTNEEYPAAKLTGIQNDASYREIKEFIRVDVMGGSDGVVRLYDEGIAFLKLENAAEFPRLFRSNGRKLRGSAVVIEGISMERWTHEYKLNKSRLERDIDMDKKEREKEQRDRRGTERDHSGRDRHQNSHSSGHHNRSSRFSNASHESSCIAIRGLAATITRQELVTRYLRDTPCQEIVLIAAPTPTNRYSVTAFVQFDSAVVAQTVIDGIVRSPLSTTLVVESCDIEDLEKAKARTTGSISAKPGMSNMLGMFQDTKSIFELDLGLDDETTTVIMKGAPPSISERDIFDFFSDIGLAPMSVRIMFDNDGQCSGQVICEFPDNNKAKRATTKDGMLFGRGQISVSLLPSRSKLGSSSVGGLASLGASASTNATEGFGSPSGQVQLLPNFLNRSQRPGLLGPGPPPSRGGGSSSGGMPRFGNPTAPTNSPNIFEQALQQQSGPGPMSRQNMGSENGGRGRSNARGGRMSRFSNNDSRNDFRNQNGMGRGGRGGSNSGNTNKDDIMTPSDEMALFNKKGCVIGLENIPYKSSMDDILQYLEDTLKIRISPNRIIRRYDEHQKATGDARVAFDTEFEAKLACDRLRGTYMWKRPVSAAVIA